MLFCFLFFFRLKPVHINTEFRYCDAILRTNLYFQDFSQSVFGSKMFLSEISAHSKPGVEILF